MYVFTDTESDWRKVVNQWTENFSAFLGARLVRFAMHLNKVGLLDSLL